MTSNTLVFEAEITPGMSPSDVVDLALLAENVGFDRLGISDVVLWPDAYVMQALAARATSRIAIGSMVTNPFSRHPVVHAAALATLQEVSDGRAFVGLGVGAELERAGIHPTRVVQTLRESITVIRGLLAGETMDYRGEVLALEECRLHRPSTVPVPVAIGTRSPGVARLAGEVADIALVGARYVTPELADQYQQWLAEGAARVERSVADVEVAPRITLCVSVDGELARSSVKRYAAHYLDLLGKDGPAVPVRRRAAIRAALQRSSGWYFDHDRYDDPAIRELVDDELATAFAVAGTPNECLEQLRAVLALGFTSVSCNLAAVKRPDNTLAEGVRETLEGAGAVVAALRSDWKGVG